MRSLPLATLAVLLTLGFASQVSPQQPPEYGPARGALVIVGGGQLDGTGIVPRVPPSRAITWFAATHRALRDQFEVTGRWKVAIHDSTRLYQPWEKPYYVL